MYRYSVPCNPRITLAAFLAHFFLQDYREGATPFAPAGRFQSTCPRRGTTIPDSKLEDSDDWFQSTLPRGERRIMPGKLPRMQSVSIHAPTRGATPDRRSIRFPCRCFNPRSHEGSDRCCVLRIFTSKGFNPRSHEGSDRR